MQKITQLHQPCPKCSSSDAYCEWEDGHGHCFSCGFHKHANEDLINLNDEYHYEYLDYRGINKSTYRVYGVLFKINREGQPTSVGFPYSNDHTKIRKFRSKDFSWTGTHKPGLFGLDKFAAGSHKHVTVTEGELDALSIYQVVHHPVVSVQSAASAQRDCSVDYEWLNSFERINLAFDNDAAGREALSRVAKLFDYNKIFVVKFTNRKDANEYLQHGEADELRNIWSNAKKYLPETVVSSLEEFKKELTGSPKEGLSYPFPSLTKMTYGIRPGECVLVKAPEKVGKSTLMHTFLHHILKETKDNVGAIFIEESKRRTLEAIAGIELRRPVHLPDSGCSEDQIYSAVQSVVGHDDRLHLYSHFGTDDPDILLDTIRFLVTARSCRYIVFDHVTMAVTGLAGDSERRALEYLATRLEILAKELLFALIVVSHVNDLGQTRGSHYLTKLADITISLERDTMATDDLVKRTIKLSVPFNRYCASSGFCCNVVFDPNTYTLTEEPWLTSPSIVPDTTEIVEGTMPLSLQSPYQGNLGSKETLTINSIGF